MGQNSKVVHWSDKLLETGELQSLMREETILSHASARTKCGLFVVLIHIPSGFDELLSS